MLDLGLKHHQLGNLEQAEKIYRQILQLDPNDVNALHLLGVVCLQRGKNEMAIEYLSQALLGKPDFAEAHNNLGNALAAQGKQEAARANYQQALQLKPDYALAQNNLGIALLALGRPEEAEVYCRQALRLRPDYAEAHHSLGVAFKSQGRPEEAVVCCQQALRLRPDYAEAHHSLGNALKAQGRLEEAVASYQQALHLRPDYAEAHKSLGMTLLLRGGFERGWPEYEWRLRCEGTGRPPGHQPLWDGSELKGKTILLFAEQGLGDTLQFVRYVSLVKQRGATVVVTCPEPLVRILATCVGIDRLVVSGTELPPCDVQAPLLSLPGLFRTSPARIPAAVPYLSTEIALVEHWRRELAPIGGFKVGIAWQGSSTHKDDRFRSIPLAQLEPLAGLPSVQLLSLQKGRGSEQLFPLAERLAIPDLGNRLEDFAETAAVLANLDLVITVDTSVAHLAGALGVPVWVALPFLPDWRWLLNREDSPWYPTLRLFRQAQPGDWPGVIHRLELELRSLVANRSA